MARKWTKAHEQQMARILALMTAEARPFADSSPEAVAARKALPFDAWARTYFPHYFFCASAPAHLLADTLVEERGIIIGELWARGFGKSVRAMLRRAHRILHGESKFIIVAGRDEDVATDKMDLIRLELKENPRLRADYGPDISPRAGDDEDKNWTACDTQVWARGIGQSCRGKLHGPHRPDDFLGDDLEDDVLARNPDREDALWDWLFSAVFPALEGAGSNAYFEVLLNMFGRNCLAVRMREAAKKLDGKGRPICRYIEFLAETAAGESAWPERYPTDVLRRMEAIMGSRLYRKEMLGKEDDEGAAFKPDWIRHFVSADFPRAEAQLRVGIDASATAKETSDYKAIIVLARLPGKTPAEARRTYCLHAWLRKATPAELIEHILWVHDRFTPGRMGCEANGFQSLLWPLIEASEDLRRRAARVGLHPIVNTASKEDRILRNQAAFERGECFFDPSEGDQKVLIDQFLDFGKTGIHDDGPDAWDMGNGQFTAVRIGATQELYRGQRREGFEELT